MKLVRLEVQRYRSFVDPVGIDLGDGMNVLVGRNNTGKSNLLNALALAMDPEIKCVPDRDHPAQMRTAVPRIVLEFELSRSGPEITLKRHLQEYEEAVGAPPAKTLASRDVARLIVEFRGGARQEYFQAGSTGARRLAADDDRHLTALRQFRKITRFVLIRSGENVEDLLSGRFRDILHLVIQDHLGSEIEKAIHARSGYLSALQDTLLDPLQRRLNTIVTHLFPDIVSTQLEPQVPQLDRTLAEMQVRLTDTAVTDLRGKGTGVRGGVLLALLRYLAEESRRSIIFAVEEPESFLHPGAQESLREALDELAGRRDVTLLVTTHSPFLLSTEPAARTICLRKDAAGYTGLATEDPSMARTVAHQELFRDAAVGALLDEATRFTLGKHQAVLLVEGTTDAAYLETAARLLNKTHILERFQVTACGGAEKAALQAIVLAHRCPVAIFLLADADDIGRASLDKLKALLRWTPKRQVLTLANRSWIPNLQDVEAEDVWSPRLMHQCAERIGDEGINGYTKVGKGSERRYDFNKEGKEQLPGLVERWATEADCEAWGKVLNELEARLARENPVTVT